MKTLFLRVGIDRGCGGTLSPLHEDGSFEYVPIPEGSKVNDDCYLTYSMLPAQWGGNLAQYVKRDGIAHYDPEFWTMTYGEPSSPKRDQLLQLQPLDYLVFYAGFQGPHIENGVCAVIGFFVVKAVHEIQHEEDKARLTHLRNNAHFRRKKFEPGLVIVEGEPTQSHLLAKARIITNGKQLVLPQIEAITGFGGSAKRAVGRWVKEGHLEKTIGWLVS